MRLNVSMCYHSNIFAALLLLRSVHKLDSNYAVTYIMVIQPTQSGIIAIGEIGDNFFFVSRSIKFVKDWEDSLVEMKRICIYMYINNRNRRKDGSLFLFL